jgi:FkbM family methyltransferase
MLWKLGYDVLRLEPASYMLARMKKFFDLFGISVVLDVGANTGQFAKYLRKEVGFSGTLVSFEPLRSAFDELQKSAAHESQWRVYNLALGESNRSGMLNVSMNSQSSSLLPMLPTHLDAAPKSKYVGEEPIEVKTLDSIYESLCTKKDSVYLKIDTQGYELNVLKGAANALEHIDTVQLEMSLVPLYQGELLFNEMYEYLRRRHYSLVSIEPVYFGDVPGQVLQVDGIFHRYGA